MNDRIKLNKPFNTFLFTMILGFIAHGFRLTNKFFCEDSFNYLNTISASWTISIGRFLLPLVEKVRGPKEATWVIGVLSLIWISFTAIVVIKLFDLKSNLYVILVSAILVCNPVVAGTFSYMYTADGYFFGLLLSVLSAYIAVKAKKFWELVISAVLLGLSMGFYQSYVSVTVLLLELWIILMLNDRAKSLKDFWKKTGSFAAMGIMAIVVYYPLMKIVMKLTDHEVAGYMGLDGEQSFSLGRIADIFINSYVEFARYYLVHFEADFYNVSNVLMFILTAVLLVILVFGRKEDKKIGAGETALRLVLETLLLLFIPLATHIFFVLSPDVKYLSAPMLYSMGIFYIFPVILMQILYERSGDIDSWKNKRDVLKQIPQGIMLAFMFTICFHFIVITDQAYESMYRANKNMENQLNRIQVRLEMTDGYEEGMHLAVIGCTYQLPDYLESAPRLSGVVSNLFMTGANEYVSGLNWFLSTDYGGATFEEYKEIVRSEEFAEMNMWPQEGCTKVIDGIMVLYLDDRDIKQYYE